MACPAAQRQTLPHRPDRAAPNPTSSRTARTSKISPPATWKSATVIPSAANMILPRKMKPPATTQTGQNSKQCLMFAIAHGDAVVPRPRKIATRPIGSIATKIGMKASKNFSRSRPGIRWSVFAWPRQSFYTSDPLLYQRNLSAMTTLLPLDLPSASETSSLLFSYSLLCLLDLARPKQSRSTTSARPPTKRTPS